MPDDLLKAYREMAALGGNFRGLSLLDNAKEISKIVRRHRSRTILDYGSGAGEAYRSPHEVHRQWLLHRTNVKLYDPSFPKLNKPIAAGAMFDGVICSDVLEHIPEPDVDDFVLKLFSHARHFVWASICCRLAKKTFPDGTNLHVTVHDMQWWRDTFAENCTGKTFYLTETP